MGAQYLTLSTVDFNARPIDDVVDTHNFKLLTVPFAQPKLICFCDIRILVLKTLPEDSEGRPKQVADSTVERYKCTVAT
jgi:hypothetical protein